MWEPIVSSIQTTLEEARPNVQSEGERISEDNQQKKRKDYPPRRGKERPWGI